MTDLTVIHIAGIARATKLNPLNIVALIKHGTTIGNADAEHNATFDKKHKPGESVALSGIYKCAGCGDEYALNKGTVFPPQNHHQHPSPGPGKPPVPIEWQLLVFAQAK